MENGRQERQLWLWVYWTKAESSQINKRQKEAQEVQVMHGKLGSKKGGRGNNQ